MTTVTHRCMESESHDVNINHSGKQSESQANCDTKSHGDDCYCYFKMCSSTHSVRSICLNPARFEVFQTCPYEVINAKSEPF